jgi:DNA-binding MarR family transcriptional regulator
MENLESTIIFQLLQIGVYLIRKGDGLIKEYGLNQQQFVLLKYIVNNQPVNQANIHSRLMLNRSNISKIVKRLSSFGLIEINENESSDKRLIFISATKAGIDLVEKGLQNFNQFDDKFFSSLSADELKEINSMLGKLVKLIK